jgi:hypothetical protein
MCSRLFYLLCLVGGVAFDNSEIELFNGRDLSGWTHELEDKTVKPDAVWTIVEGVLICKGSPAGYLRTENEYENYQFTLEWRWPAGSPGGNSGVLLHTTEPLALGIWPKSVEAQLAAGDAGDVWVIGTTVDVENPDVRRQGRRHLNLTDGSERPIGEWNQCEIVCQGSEITINVNGTLVNRVTNASVTRGAIALQSEGAEIHFRNIKLRPLPPAAER